MRGRRRYSREGDSAALLSYGRSGEDQVLSHLVLRVVDCSRAVGTLTQTAHGATPAGVGQVAIGVSAVEGFGPGEEPTVLFGDDIKKFGHGGSLRTPG